MQNRLPGILFMAACSMPLTEARAGYDGALELELESGPAWFGRNDVRIPSGDDVGLVPLLHLRGEYRWNDRWRSVVDMDFAAAPQGRAVDLALQQRFTLSSGWYGSVGYRTLEGGADNDDLYTFAWLHYLTLGVGYRF